MTNVELKTARKLLGLSQAEAAKYIGGVTQRSWDYWESGGRSIPHDVTNKIESLLSCRKEAIKHVQNLMLRADADLSKIVVVYYQTPDSCNDVLDWRFKQSLAATLSHDYGASLVPFDAKDYAGFLILNGLFDDTQDNRAKWATTKVNNTA